MKAIMLLTLLSVTTAFAQVEKRAWDPSSAPDRISGNETQFALLPLEATVANPKRYWSSDYWSKKKGGINYRWNAARPSGQKLKSPSREQVARMSEQELATLAPSEKLDLLSGAYNYPLKSEIARYANPSAPSWEGICNGWAEASIHHDEPNPITLTNPEGIAIPFGSSDIKALLSWWYFREDNINFSGMGRRCRGGWFQDCSNDLNAGAFYLVLTNRVGLQGVSFVADMDPGKEVWNHAIYSYKSKIIDDNLRPRSTSARGSVRVIRVRTVVDYTFVLKKNMWTPVLGTPEQKLNSRTYDYYLDIDGSGRIIGGDWISKQRPDFLWITDRAAGFSGNMAALQTIVDALGI